MAQNEKVLWNILALLDGHGITMSNTLLGEDPKTHRVENAYGTGDLKGELVLKHSPTDIEDTIYFMKNRGYLTTHGFRMLSPEMALALSDKALEVSQSKKLPPEEEQAFKEALWDLSKPKVYGLVFNLGELWRRGKKKFRCRPR